MPKAMRSSREPAVGKTNKLPIIDRSPTHAAEHPVLDDKQLMKASMKSHSVLEEFINSLKPIESPSLDRRALTRLRINLDSFDLQQTKTMFVRPVPLETLSSWLEEKQPWLQCGQGHGIDECNDDNWMDAKFLGYDLLRFLLYSTSGKRREVPTSGPKAGLMGDKTGWSERRDGATIDMECRSGHAYSNAIFILDHEDPTIPHITACICSRDGLANDSLTQAEVIAILQLTFLRQQEMLCFNKTVPVTLISLAGLDCRVLLADLDVGRSILNVHKSKILSFDYKDSYMSDDWKHVIPWAVAEPVVKSNA